MRRIIRLDGQIAESDRCFAVWDTVRDRFDTFNDSQAWDSADELEADLAEHLKSAREAVANIAVGTDTADRYLADTEATGRRVLSLARSAGY